MDTIIVNIDAETIPPGELEGFKVTKSPPKTMKKEETIKTWIEENKEKEFRDQSKNPALAELLCLGFSMESKKELERDPSIEPEYKILYNDTEYNMLKTLEDELKNALCSKFEEGGEEREFVNDILWMGFNIRRYDLELLWFKAIKYDLNFLSKLIPRKRFDESVFDLAEKFLGPRSNEFVKFDFCLDVLGLGSKTDGMDGSMVYDQYIAGNLESVIVPYCIDDVRKNRELYIKISKGIL